MSIYYSNTEDSDARNLKYRRVTNEFPKFITPVVCDGNFLLINQL